MTVYGKRINKKQAEALDFLFSCLDDIHKEVAEYGEEQLDMTDGSHTILSAAEDVFIAFGHAKKKFL